MTERGLGPIVADLDTTDGGEPLVRRGGWRRRVVQLRPPDGLAGGAVRIERRVPATALSFPVISSVWST